MQDKEIRRKGQKNIIINKRKQNKRKTETRELVVA